MGISWSKKGRSYRENCGVERSNFILLLSQPTFRASRWWGKVLIAEKDFFWKITSTLCDIILIAKNGFKRALDGFIVE